MLHVHPFTPCPPNRGKAIWTNLAAGTLTADGSPTTTNFYRFRCHLPVRITNVRLNGNEARLECPTQ